jgi:hypothetical protein
MAERREVLTAPEGMFRVIRMELTGDVFPAGDHGNVEAARIAAAEIRRQATSGQVKYHVFDDKARRVD